jgi:putative restriction endonuclease
MPNDTSDATNPVAPATKPTLVSTLLAPGNLYRREDLQQLLKTRDATINTGVFHPAGYDSVLLFVTENKTRDRTQYVDKLEGDVLTWQGQKEGRTDAKIIEHAARGLELLLFYRKKKDEYARGAFRYEGPFRYDSHHGARPTTFTLNRVDVNFAQAETEVAASGEFDPNSIEDARQRLYRAIVRRQGQPAFRRALLNAYERRCAITGCDVEQVLEAAHIVPYRGPATNHVTNGLLLRGDLHTLFDLGAVTIDPASLRVVIAESLRSSDYGAWHDAPLRQPRSAEHHPSLEALALHHEQHQPTQ